jgi:hypothetical protein
VTSTHDRAAAATHEGAHVAALVTSGRLPLRATADWPEPNRAGFVSLDFENYCVSPDNAHEFMLVALMGALVERTPGWPHE